MNFVTLRIVLHGLIALVPTLDDGGHHITALVVNGLMPHDVEGKCQEVTHHPTLKFLAVEPKQCTPAGCTFSDFQCTCEAKALTGSQIWLDIQPKPAQDSQRPNNERPVHSIPPTPEAAGDPAYIANLSQAPFNLTIDKEFLGASPSPQHLLARMRVPFQALTACMLATREDGGQDNVYAMSFRKLHDPSQASESSQALAQMAIAKLEIPVVEETKVVLKIKKFAEGDDQAKAIELRAGGQGYKIELSNQPRLPLDRDDPCNGMVARHFSMFYELAETKPQERDFLFPHFRLDRSVERMSVTPDLCKAPVFGLMDRPACPMAIFNP